MIFYILLIICGFSSTLLADESACNNKYKNLLKLESIFKNDSSAKIPPFLSISSERIEQFILREKPDFYKLYHEELKHLQNPMPVAVETPRSWWQTFKEYVHKLKAMILEPTSFNSLISYLFHRKVFPFTRDEVAFFDASSKNNTFLMVRSSGLEDSKTMANAGLYVSVPYVSAALHSSIQTAMGHVVGSYFNPQALKNNLIAGLDLYTLPLCIPVLIQQLIGEPFGGTQNTAEIPVSGVAFTTQSSLSSEKFKITEINASYGHGEGVVANRVSTDRYYVTPSKIDGDPLSIYSMINYKRDRLVPTSDANHRLAMIPNPEDLRAKPCLTIEQIRSLYGVLQKIETAYGQPMDVEFVIQNNSIYIVQARPAMKFEQKPSYIPDAALSEKERGQIVSVNTVVAGSSQVCIVTDPSKIIVKDNLDEADADERRSTAQAVFVGAWASSLSHAAVNFIGFGIPCFYVQDLTLIKNMLTSISDERPLIIDTQRQLVYLWDNKQKAVDTAIVFGWYEHPISRALSLIEGMNNYQILLNTATVPQDALLIKKMAELKDKLGSVGQKELFENIEERINDRIKVTEKRIRSKANLCNAQCLENFTAFKKQLNSLIIVLKSAIDHNADRLELLFHHKMLEALLYQTHDSSGINRYTYRWFLDYLFAKQVITGSISITNNLHTLLEYGHLCPDKELITAWQTFIKKVDALISSKAIALEELHNLTSFLSLLDKVNAIPLWFATIFYSQMAKLSQQQTNDAVVIRDMLEAFNNEYSDETQQFIVFINSIHNNLGTIKTAMQQKLDTVPAVEIFWKEVHSLLIDPLSSPAFFSKFSQAPLLGKLMLCQELISVVDTIDESIKQLKSSRALPFDERKRLFHLMLSDFLTLCKQWLTNLMPENALEYHMSWGLNSYLEKVSDLFENIFKHFSDTREDQFFQKSPGFSVEAAILGSKTAFERHYPETPEDLFMLIHQNTLIAVSATYKSLFGGKKIAEVIYLPQKFRTIFEYIESEASVGKSLIGFKYNEKEIVASYNVPLSNHSATFQISYSFMTQDIVFHMQYLGDSRSRWEQIAVMAAISPELSGLTLEGPIVLDNQGGMVSWKWHIYNEENARLIIEYVKIANQISFSDINTVSSAPVHKTPGSLKTIFKKAYPRFLQRIRGSLRQDWQARIELIPE